MMRYARRAFAAYGKLVLKRPLVSQIVTAGVLVTTGDAITQSTIERKTKYDFHRTAVMATCGFAYFGPMVGVWLSLLNRLRFATALKVGMDQFLFAPTILSGFFTLQSLLNGKSLEAGIGRVVTEVLSVILVNWLVWIPAQFINFRFVPFQYRMLFVQSVALFWNCYLSLRANRATGPEKPAVDKRDAKSG